MTWLDNLKHIEPIEVNVSDYTRPDLGDYIVQKHNELSGTWWLNLTSIVFFLFGILTFAKKNGFLQGIMLSSYCALMVSVAFILDGFSYSIYPFFLFGVIWVISVLAVYNLKQGGGLNP